MEEEGEHINGLVDSQVYDDDDDDDLDSTDACRDCDEDEDDDEYSPDREHEFDDYEGSDEEEGEHQNEYSFSPLTLHQACEIGDKETVSKLLKSGEDANKMERDGKTPLHFASALGDPDLVKILLSHNAIPTIFTNDGKYQTCLHIAAMSGSSETIQAILDSVLQSDNKDEVTNFIRMKDSTGNSAIHYASENGFMDCVDILVTNGADINEKDETGKNSVHICAQFGKDYALELLISHGASFDEPDDEGRTPLHWACIGGNKYCVDLLYQKGANLMARDSTGLTPLHLACLNGNLEIIDLLESTGNCDINITDNFGRSPLLAAASSGHKECCEFLLEYYAILTQIDDLGRSVLTWVVHSPPSLDDHSILECLQMLWGWWEVDCKISNKRIEDTGAYQADKLGRNPLHYACYYKHYACTSYLLANGVNALQKDTNGRTAVHYSVHSKKFLQLFHDRSISLTERDNRGCPPILLAGYSGNLHSVSFLAENGCSLHEKDNFDRTIIHYLALNKSIDNSEQLLRYFIDSNLQLDATDNQGKTPIHIAASVGNLPFLEAVASIFKGPELLYYLNLTEKKGRQATHLAAISNHPELLAFLIINGADSTHQDNAHLTPLHYAVALDKNECALSCIAAKVDTNCVDNEGKPPLFYSSWFGLNDMVDSLLFYGADVEFVDKKKNTALHYAAFADNPLIITILIEGGANTTAKNAEELTPLHITCSKGNQTTLQMIIENGLSPNDLNVTDKNKRTPLHYACAAGNTNCARVLIENGADIDATDAFGQTALSIAAQFGNTPCISLLLENKAKVKVIDDNGRHPLHWAAWKGSIRSCEILVPVSNIDATDSLRRTPLHYAVSKGDLKLVEFLLSCGSKVDFVDSEGASPLMLACFYQQFEIASILIKSGADVSLVDEMDRKCVQYTKAGAKHFGNKISSPACTDFLSLLIKN